MSAQTWAAVSAAGMIAWSAASAQAQDPAPGPAAAVSFERDARAILRKRCGNCHNADRPRGDLNVLTYAGIRAGGTGGPVVVPGAPEESPLYTLAAHLEEPRMPPNAPRIPQRELDVIRRWIEGGLVERPGDAPASPSAERPASTPDATVAEPSPPDGLQPATPLRAPAAITALAVSPTEPVAAVSAWKQVLLFDLATRTLRGALPFPEGDVLALRFSPDGKTLLAAGGVGAESGKAVLFEVGTWRRLAAIGDELDAILAADLAPDGTQAVIAGPSRVVKLLAVPGGAERQAFRKPTDWVTAASFSPDGLLVAAGDRFGGLFLWEAESGKEFLATRAHDKAVAALGWIAGRDRLVTAGEDGQIRLFDLHTGAAASSWVAHPDGVLGLDVHASGRIASAGRDRRIKVWEPDGTLAADLGPTRDQATRVAWTADGRGLISGDWSGGVLAWTLGESTGARLPIPLLDRPATAIRVVPMLTPARAHAPAVVARAAEPTAQPQAEDLSAALASAREAAAAAERASSMLARLVESRGTGSDAPPSPASPSALRSAEAALEALEAALRAAPGSLPLRQAREQTLRAVEQLRADGPGRAGPTSDR